MDIPPISANPGLACDVLHLCWWGRASMVGRLLSPTTLTTFSDHSAIIARLHLNFTSEQKRRIV